MRTIRLFCVAIILIAVFGITSKLCSAEAPQHDLSKEKVLYCVGYAHLDTQWRWDYATTIGKFLKNTLDENFDRFQKFPGYTFNFTGSVRYELMKEYYPEKFAKLKDYVAANRWYVSGSSVDEGDVNIPSPESVIRQVLYGNGFFRREFGKESVDYMLPDSFGFQAHLPSIWAHCGLLGFSTQKLTWGSAVGIPFKIGMWEGPDGKAIIAALDPGDYAGAIEGPVNTNEKWVKRVEENGQKYGVFGDFHYYGVGDVGGAPQEKDVRNYVDSSNKKDGPMQVLLTSSSQMFKDITPEMKAKLPRFKGDMLLTQHSAGTLTSEAYMKKCNRKGEILADAAERAAVTANWLGGAAYPREKLEKSWVRLLANQMHDILPGTAISRGYKFAWNAEFVAFNGFAAVLTDSVGAIAKGMDTSGLGRPLIVFNPLAQPREDIVQARVEFDDTAPKSIAVFDLQTREVPSQILHRDGHAIDILFLARVPAMSFSIFDVHGSITPFKGPSSLKVSKNSLENEQYRVTINADGDVSSIVHKIEGDRELLSGPAKLVFTHEKPREWPAWNMDWKDRSKPPIDSLHGPAKIRIVESGPVRVALEISRSGRDSTVVQQIRLARGDAGQRVEFKNEIDWQSTECALKAAFPLAASNPNATYNLGLGTIERGNNDPKKYEVPSREWFDLMDQSGEFGVSVLEDCKFGSDKPADNLLRLTLLYTPGIHKGYQDQHSQDWGRHDITYALYGHAGGWRTGRTEWQARRLNQPLIAFQAPGHKGPLGRSFSFAGVNTEQVDIRALKLAEHGDEIIVRLQELWGKPANGVAILFASPIASAYEVDGQERRIGEAKVDGRKLVFDMTPYSPRSFAVRLAPPSTKVDFPGSMIVDLPYNEDVFSTEADLTDGKMDREGRTFPAEMLPPSIAKTLPPCIISEGIVFKVGPTTPRAMNAVACKGQTIDLPSVDCSRLYLLAAAVSDTVGRFQIGKKSQDLAIESWTGLIGQFDDRVWDRPFDEIDYVCEGHVTGITPAFAKRDCIAWFSTHRHHPKLGNEPYQFSYLFKYALDLPKSASTLRLPDNDRIKILAMTLASNVNDNVRPAAPLYDDFTNRAPIKMRHVYPPPAPPAHKGLTPIAKVAMDRRSRFEELSMGPPSNSDYADQASGHGVVFRYFGGEGDYQPHGNSGAVRDTLPRLNDGQVAQNDDDTKRCVWYDSEGRFYADLGKSMKIGKINSYSWHNSNRAPQVYSLWGSNADAMPPVDFSTGKNSQWTLIAVVDSRKLGNGGVHGVSITGPHGPLGPYRHLLWIADNIGEGTFFTEIDVHEPR